ncbi:hypothetical protein PBRA_001902 [Plasmodiophora brassicae]|nr:hypothetical protein PBRA_001902 [Plasmodiophora brassicae]
MWQWAQKGTQFLKNGDCKTVDDDVSLSFMYGSKATRQTVSDAAKGALEQGPDVQERMGSMFGDTSIRDRCERYGQEIIVAVTSSMSEVCERELQVEQEEQEEDEREIEAMQPHEEQPWKYGDVLQCDSMVSFSADTLPVGDALSGLSIDVVNWEQAKLWATANFMRTVEQGHPCLDYLRVADVVVVFENDDAVQLLSDQYTYVRDEYCGNGVT